MAAFLAVPEIHFVPEPFRPACRKSLGISRFTQQFFGDLPNDFLLGILLGKPLGISSRSSAGRCAYGDFLWEMPNGLPTGLPNGFLLGISRVAWLLFID